jgi:RecA-family ATPase
MVTLFVGETSAGKTVFLHNLAYHLATGKEFLGITPVRPMRVLYVDYETPSEVLVEHFTNIGVSEGWDFYPVGPAEGGIDNDGR